MNPLRFETKVRCAMGRIGLMDVNGRRAETPLLMPVVNPNIQTLTPKDLMDIWGFKAIITNAYILYKGRDKDRALESGIHKVLDFSGIIMTDSGTFQSHVYGDVDVGNAEIVSFQRDIGVDIGTVLDVFTEVEDGVGVAKSKLIETLKRTEEALKVRGDMALNATIQGGIYPQLRRMAARRINRLGCDYHTIGGVVPLMESYNYTALVDIILAVRSSLDVSKPLHLFGGGHPLIFPLAVALGVDIFDSASYVKYARDGRMMFPHGTEHIEDMKNLPCNCPACSKYRNADDLASAGDDERTRAIAAHNLYVSVSELDRVKNAIHNGTLWDLVEQRAGMAPELMDATRHLRRVLPRYYMFSSKGRRSVNSSGIISISRPEFVLYNRRLLERYTPPTTAHLLLLEDYQRPYSSTANRVMDVIRSMALNTHLCLVREYGPVPWDLVWHYPNAQSRFPTSLTKKERAGAWVRVKGFASAMGYKGVSVLDKRDALGHLSRIIDSGIIKKGFMWVEDYWRIRSSLDMAYGPGAGEAVIPEANGMGVVRSRNTGMIRNALYKGLHVASIDATTGTAFVKLCGAEALYSNGVRGHCVVVTGESAEYNAKGKSVFARFIVSMGPDVVPGDEVYVVSEDTGDVVATGRTLIGARELPYVKGGVAVNIRFHKA